MAQHPPLSPPAVPLKGIPIPDVSGSNVPNAASEPPPVVIEHVDHVLPEVIERVAEWGLIRDAVDGEQKIKAAARRGRYLPYIAPEDKTPENKARNEAYIDRAVFVNITKRTLRGMVGQVFGKPAVATLPALLDALVEDIDGGAVSIDQQAKQALSDVMAVGRCGLLADFPVMLDEEGKTRAVSRADMESGNIRPVIQYYFAEQIINWRVETIGSKRKLTLVVLEESYTLSDDGFKKVDAPQWRVLRLESQANGKHAYAVQLYRRNDAGNIVRHGDTLMPLDGRGQPFDEIPFAVAGSQNNDPGIDEPPLYDIASLNLAHFRNSADYEEMVWLVGQVTPVYAGLTQNWVDEVMTKDGKSVGFGSRNPIALPKGGTAQLLQAQPNSLAFEAMTHKEKQLVALGAKLVENKQVQQTATQSRQEEASEASTLQTAAQNVSAAYTRALQWAAMFAGAPISEDLSYELNTDFEISKLDSAGRAQLLKEWQGGAISWTEYRTILRRAGVATLEDEEAKAEIDEEAAKAATLMGMGPDDEPTDPNAEPGQKPGQKPGGSEDVTE